MTTESLSGIVWPQDEGSNTALSGSHDKDSAGYIGLLAKLNNSKYIIDGTLQFSNIGNDTATLGTGVAVLPVSNVKVQSGAQNSYDTTLPEPSLTVACVTQSHTLNLDSNAVNNVYLTYDQSVQDTINVVYGSNVSTPSYPYIKIGSIDTNDDTVSTRPNDAPSINARQIQSQKYEADDGTVYDLQSDIVGQSARSTVTTTGNYTASNYERVLADASSGSVTVTLPQSSTYLSVVVKKIDTSSNSVVVEGPSGDIDRSASLSLDWSTEGIGEAVKITGDGSNYWVI